MTMSKLTLATERNEKPFVVVKLGGSMLDRLSEEFYQSFTVLRKHYHCIIVHGGGPAITSMLDRLKIESEFHEGSRKTTTESLEVVEMVMSGKVNAQITSNLGRQSIRAVGIKGSDASILTASYVDQQKWGYVGKIEQVETDLLLRFLEADYLPVLAPLGKTQGGQTLNINADLAAAAVAKAMNAEKLLFVTDVPGIMRQGAVVKETTPSEITSLIENGGIYGGMIPKVKSAVEALSDQLQEVRIVSGEQPLIQQDQMVGTKIRSKRKEEVE
ncbi:acetylglutamate kinase [Halobacillus shinanisalinarum]|uniref:Acetylglutamate kinase n=1 Tax=Halobacillus shinanisalinarum TaxID=2932258 RepID=A0ABY4H526_9BACI|nr:acetylglutamate kinase [Halobacillus shinanisalinarum]UOQ95316.1 acetylglutamate kinase [Halobacillus shinanisalinarum]